MTKYFSSSKYNDGFISSKPLLVTFVIDISPSTKNKGFKKGTANELINMHFKRFISQLAGVPKILANAYIRVLTYSSEVTDVFKGFIPLCELKDNVPDFKAVKTGVTRTMAAVEDGVDGILNYAKEISEFSECDLYTSVLVLLTDGDESLHDSEEYRAQVIKKVNECTKAPTRDKKILPVIVALGDHIGDSTREHLSSLSEGFIDGHFCIPSNSDDTDTDFSKLFEFISSTIVASIRIDSVEVLLEDLRNLVSKNYSHMIYPKAS